jgi:hypothetical protein
MGPPAAALATVLAVDLVFTGYDIAATDPNEGWAIAQTAVTGPQAGLIDLVVLADPTLSAGYVTGLNVWLNQLAVYGPIRMSNKERPHWPSYGLSWAFGGDIAVGASALGSAFKGRWSTPENAIIELVVAAPQIAVGAVALAKTSWPSRPLVIGLGAVSTLVLAHGISSLLAAGSPTPTERRTATRWDLRFERRRGGMMLSLTGSI